MTPCNYNHHVCGSYQGFRNDFQEAMEKVDQDYLDSIISSHMKVEKSEEEKCLTEDPMKVYENIKTDAVELGKGDSSKDNEIILKFLQVRMNLNNKVFLFYLSTRITNDVDFF